MSNVRFYIPTCTQNNIIGRKLVVKAGDEVLCDADFPRDSLEHVVHGVPDKFSVELSNITQSFNTCGTRKRDFDLTADNPAVVGHVNIRVEPTDVVPNGESDVDGGTVPASGSGESVSESPAPVFANPLFGTHLKPGGTERKDVGDASTD